MAQTDFSSDFGGPAESNNGSIFEEPAPQTSAELMDTLETDLQNMAIINNEPSLNEVVSAPATPLTQSRPRGTIEPSSPESRLRSFASNPRASPAERRAAAQARRAARLPNFAAMAGFHRPLPLRNYESEAFLFPTARAQGLHGRASSLDTPSRRRSRPLDIAGLDEFSRRVGPSNLSTHRLSRALSNASEKSTSIRSVVIAQFPDVPTSTAPLDPDSLGEVYKSVTEAYLKQTLERTRARGALLPAIELDSLTSFERAWRTQNEQLLKAIYGRNDVTLTEDDVNHIDRIVKELSSGVGTIGGYEWVGALFQHLHR